MIHNLRIKWACFLFGGIIFTTFGFDNVMATSWDVFIDVPLQWGEDCKSFSSYIPICDGDRGCGQDNWSACSECKEKGSVLRCYCKKQVQR